MDELLTLRITNFKKIQETTTISNFKNGESLQTISASKWKYFESSQRPKFEQSQIDQWSYAWIFGQGKVLLDQIDKEIPKPSLLPVWISFVQGCRLTQFEL